MGHNTPTNVLAWSGEQVNEQHKAIAIVNFFTSAPTTSRRAPRCDNTNAGQLAPLAVD
jgi:hypothetical protein